MAYKFPPILERKKGGVAFGNFIRRLPGKNEKCAVIDADEAGSLVNYCALIDSRIFGRERKKEREKARAAERRKKSKTTNSDGGSWKVRENPLGR